jgi:hypothetical protein
VGALNPEQRRAAEHQGAPRTIIAGPGTGGDQENFIKLADAYHSLLAAKVEEIKTRL